jgi:hypothetical protein
LRGAWAGGAIVAVSEVDGSWINRVSD